MNTVTVIIPAYNSARFIEDAIESALRQSIPPTQVIVVDDGSTDDTELILRSYVGRITVICQPNQGAAAARNAGLCIATGQYVAFLDADDVWHPRKLELQLDALRRRPELEILGTDTFDYPCAVPTEITAAPRFEEIPLDRLLVRNYFASSSVVVRRETILRFNGFDTTMPIAEDFDLWQRIAQVGVVANLRSPLTGYRPVPGSLSRQPAGVEQGIRRIVRKLDERNAWRGRYWLRCKAISHLHYSVAYLHGAAGRHGLALWKMLQSLVWYPLPYRRSEAGLTLGRPRRAMVMSLRLLGLKRPEMPLTAAGPAWKTGPR
jgi:glycosyltransferase involved in cell wall biosynthesis